MLRNNESFKIATDTKNLNEITMHKIDQNNTLTPLIIGGVDEKKNSRRHPTALARSNLDIYGKISGIRENEKSLVLPDITRSTETVLQPS